NAPDTSAITAAFPRGLLYGAALTGGIASLGLEMTMSRLVGAVLGTSNLVWAAVITLTLLYLTLGYWLGGRWADRSPQPGTLLGILAAAALAGGLLPLIYRPLILAMARAFSLVSFDGAVLALSFVSVALLFALPVTLLGCVSPFVVRLLVGDVTQAGRVAGRVYALSTLGSLLGTFTPVLVLIPALGTARTFLLLSALLLAVAFAGFWRLGGMRLMLRRAWMPALLVVALLLYAGGPVKPAPAGTRLLYEAETPYNYVQVVEVTTDTVSLQPPGTRLLLLNEGQGVHSVYHPDVLRTQGTWDYFLTAPYYNPAPYAPDQLRRIAVVGLAAGTIAQQYTAVYGEGVQIDGIEIDPGIVEAGRRYFGMTMPNLNVIVEDGRYAFQGLEGGYDLIAIEAYRVPYIPWQLTTVEYFRELRDHLAPEGVLMINVGRASSDRRLVEAMTATLLEVFPTVHTLDVPRSFNTMLTATQMPTTPENLLANRDALPTDAHPLLGEMLDAAYAAGMPTVSSGLVFTDDRAPVETLVNAMVLEFILGEGSVN
ncbi:MAG: fused MFS/spermidine synthase, partial [Caldilineaceae bacterium]|nr:fused MFS/spermidine synthase [Caldilineaceae bacterium]